MSQGVITSELMLFEPNEVNEGVEYLQYIECRPNNQITEDGSVDIHIKESGSQYLDLQRSRLHVSSSGTNYAYKAYMDVLLNFSEDVERYPIQTQLFYKDSPGAFDQTKITEIPLNQGLILGQKLAKNSQLVDMCGPIFADTFNMCQDICLTKWMCT